MILARVFVTRVAVRSNIKRLSPEDEKRRHLRPVANPNPQVRYFVGVACSCNFVLKVESCDLRFSVGAWT